MKSRVPGILGATMGRNRELGRAARLLIRKSSFLNNANRSFVIGCVAQVVTARAKNGNFGVSAPEWSEGNVCA